MILLSTKDIQFQVPLKKKKRVAHHASVKHGKYQKYTKHGHIYPKKKKVSHCLHYANPLAQALSVLVVSS